MENRIKECQLDLFADRTSAATMRANQLRLWFASMAYVLVTALRRIGLAGTELATATCGTIRLKLLKIGALVTRSVRRIRIAMASSCPDAAVFRLALGRSIQNLQASWVKMGLEGATEALRWGVNDLGGTLMEESISRMAGSHHGVRLDPPQLISAAHHAGRPAAERTTLYAVREEHPLTSRVSG